MYTLWAAISVRWRWSEGREWASLVRRCPTRIASQPVWWAYHRP